MFEAQLLHLGPLSGSKGESLPMIKRNDLAKALWFSEPGQLKVTHEMVLTTCVNAHAGSIAARKLGDCIMKPSWFFFN